VNSTSGYRCDDTGALGLAVLRRSVGPTSQLAATGRVIAEADLPVDWEPDAVAGAHARPLGAEPGLAWTRRR
jgi:hypothetical protein